MAIRIAFDTDFAEFGSYVEKFARADDVGKVVSRFLWFDGTPFYPIGALLKSKISHQWLGQGKIPKNDTENLDLLFCMRDLTGTQWYEIILRSRGGVSYGGYLVGKHPSILDEIVNGHRVITTLFIGVLLRYEFDGQVYGPPKLASLESNSLTGVTALRRAIKSSHNK